MKIIKKLYRVLLSKYEHRIFPFKYFFGKKKYLAKKIWGGGLMETELSNNFEIFLSGAEKKNSRLLNHLEKDIIRCNILYGATPQEYFLFGFRDLSEAKRSQFLTNEFKDKVMISKVGLEENWDLLENKIIFYENFKKYFHRDFCAIRDEKDFEDFLVFVKKHNNYIIKPIDGQCGAGIEVREINDFETAKKEFNYILSKGNYLAEELIVQDAIMAQWNKTSVNTIRLPAFVNNRGFHILKPFLRTGRDGKVIDNGNSGGIFAVIDEKSGKISTNGYDVKGNTYKIHPDSKKIFKDWQIPFWSDLLKLAEEVHRTIPHYPYVGWDFALSNKGWVLLEGNWGQFLSKFADKEGIKSKFVALFDK